MVRLALVTLIACMAVTPVLADDSSYAALTGKPLPTISGDVSLGFGFVHTNTRVDSAFPFSDPLSSSHYADLVKGYGRVNVPLASRWNFEFEATGQSAWRSGSVSDFGGSGHLWANLPNAALGIFGGVSAGSTTSAVSMNLGGPGAVVTPTGSLESAVAGIEGEVYLANLTVGGQASVSWNTLSSSLFPLRSDSVGFHTWQLRAYAHYYFTPNDKLTGEVKYTDLPRSPVPQVFIVASPVIIPDQFSWQVTGRFEHRFAGTPWSIWASGSYEAVSDPPVYSAIGSINRDVWTALIGFQLFMDVPNSTLQGHDRLVPFDYDNSIDVIWYRYRALA